jgi:hypothetical protein
LFFSRAFQSLRKFASDLFQIGGLVEIHPLGSPARLRNSEEQVVEIDIDARLVQGSPNS